MFAKAAPNRGGMVVLAAGAVPAVAVFGRAQTLRQQLRLAMKAAAARRAGAACRTLTTLRQSGSAPLHARLTVLERQWLRHELARIAVVVGCGPKA